MNLYLAAKYNDRNTRPDVGLDAIVQWVTEVGHEITYPWWDVKAIKPFWSDPQHNLPIAERMRDGVLEADCLVLYVSDGMMGGWIEFGIALAELKPIVCIGGWPNLHPSKKHITEHNRRDSIFELFPCVRHAHHKGQLLTHLAAIQADLTTPHRSSGAPIMVDQELDERNYPDEDDYDEREPMIEHTEGAE